MAVSAALRNIKKTAIQLKGSLFTLTVLQIFDQDIVQVTHQLQEKLEQTPTFFQNAPIVIDVQHLPPHTKSFDFTALNAELRKLDLIPVGVKGADGKFTKSIRGSGLAVLTTLKETCEPKQNQCTEKENKTPHHSNTIITKPVRSGQQIYAQGGDLIVTAPVSNGAELLADGNIHIYGPLRGRALAGIHGDTNARIFCRSLESPLISIAGRYSIKQDKKITAKKGVIHIYLEDDKVQIAEL